MKFYPTSQLSMLLELEELTADSLKAVKSSMLQAPQIDLVYKSGKSFSGMVQVGSSTDGCNVLRQGWEDGKMELQEQFKVVLLNRANKVLGIYETSTGGVSGTVADPKLIFAAALLACASSIILCHNHPSGNLKPSQADLQMTKKIKEGAELLDIAVLDHLILTQESYFSFADEGLL